MSKINDLVRNIELIEEPVIKIINEQLITISPKISSLKKYWLVRTAIESAFDSNNGMYDILYSNVLFKILLIENYTDIELSDLDKTSENFFTTYDVLKTIGVFDVLEEVCSEDLKELSKLKEMHLEMLFKQQNSFALLGEKLGLSSSLPDMNELTELLGDEQKLSVAKTLIKGAETIT